MALALSVRDARAVRLRSLLLQDGDKVDPVDVTNWFGAMQGQDYASILWSLGCRNSALTQVDVEQVLADRQIVRTWPMRGTIHLVPARDISWMLRTTGALALRGVQRRWDYLGLDEAIVTRAADVLREALEDGLLPRSQALAAISDAGISTEGQRGYHLLWYAAQVGVSYIGPNQGKEQTFGLLSQLPQRELSDADGYAQYARSYFRSHGPASVADFARWLGTSIGAARKAVASIGNELVEVCVDGIDQLACAAALEQQVSDAESGRILLLSGFDEFMLGYKDRSLLLDPKFNDAIVPGGNGVFRWSVVSDGEVIGTWNRKRKTRSVEVAIEAFSSLAKSTRRQLESQIRAYGDFIGLPAVAV